jgi:hypothetical protein
MKYIIVHPTEGIFLGTTKNHGVDVENSKGEVTTPRLLALFSSNNIFDIVKCVGFFTEEDALEYRKLYIGKRFPESFVVGVQDNNDDNPYVDVIDIVKSGYGEYAWGMIDALPSPSDTLH